MAGPEGPVSCFNQPRKPHPCATQSPGPANLKNKRIFRAILSRASRLHHPSNVTINLHSSCTVLFPSRIVPFLIKRSTSANLFPCPKIDVLHWNARNVFVKCPYCEEIHRHGLALPGRRVSHCHPGGQYEFIFPIDESSELVGYEIDKRRSRFVIVSLQIGQRDEDFCSSERDECELAPPFFFWPYNGNLGHRTKVRASFGSQ